MARVYEVNDFLMVCRSRFHEQISSSEKHVSYLFIDPSTKRRSAV